ncbi:hypothetical protein Tco_1226006 [Tanacetum coccineum]
MEETLSKFMSESVKKHEENSNMIKEIQASTDAAIQNQGALIKTLEIQIDQISKNKKFMFKSRQMTIPFPSRLSDYYCEEKKRSYGPQFLEAYSYEASHIDNSIPRKEKDPRSFTLSCYINNVCFDNAFADLGASLRRDRVDDLMPTMEEGEVIKEFRARNDARMDKLEYKGNNVVGALMNIPLFVETFSVLTDFAVLEDMDAYCDEGMGDVIFGEPFLREVVINARRFEGIITIYNGNEEVTYQMVRSHPRFKHHTNEQCNKIPPFLKVSEEDKMNGILHPYQKLKSFYKGVLNLGPEYVRDAKMEEWLTRGHISVHEME